MKVRNGNERMVLKIARKKKVMSWQWSTKLPKSHRRILTEQFS